MAENSTSVRVLRKLCRACLTFLIVADRPSFRDCLNGQLTDRLSVCVGTVYTGLQCPFFQYYVRLNNEHRGHMFITYITVTANLTIEQFGVVLKS
jgi:hypothetical protein